LLIFKLFKKIFLFEIFHRTIEKNVFVILINNKNIVSVRVHIA
jgi:hypothetical protein